MSDDHHLSHPIHPLVAAVLAKGGSIHTDADAIREAILIDDMPSIVDILTRSADVDGAINDPNSALWTPLEVAAGSGRLDAIRLLIEYGADVHCHSRHCGGPLFRAFEDSQAESVRLLLEHGADPNGRDVYGGEPALISAVWWAGGARHNGASGAADRAIVRALLEYGADVNAIHEGKTALMTAVHNAGPDPDMVRLLLASGADNRLRDQFGRTALDEARAMADGFNSHGFTPRPEALDILGILDEAEHIALASRTEDAAGQLPPAARQIRRRTKRRSGQL